MTEYTLEQALEVKELRALNAMVEIQCRFIEEDDTFCAECYWEVFKPLVTPVLGWSRGYPLRHQVEPSDKPLAYSPVNLGEIMVGDSARDTPTSEFEAWLRTHEAYDLVTDHWLTKLRAIDPANGHGFRKGS